MLISHRATNILLVLILAVGIGIVAMLAAGARGGPLDPPGPVASTDSVRLPGTPISTLPFVITTPGAYYVTRDLTAAPSVDGISVTASDVTLDLGGFTLHGSATAMAVVVTSPQDNVTVRNGVVTGWSAGLKLWQATHARVSGVRVLANGMSDNGIQVGSQSIVTDCVVDGGDDAVSLSGVDSRVDGCWLRNSYTGIVAVDNSEVTNNIVMGATGGCGIMVNGVGSRIDGNHVSYSHIGYCTNNGAIANVFTRNFARGNVSGLTNTNYINVDSTKNELGPINNAAAAGTSPWGNIEY